MLKDRLQPILAEIEKQDDNNARYQSVHAWFTTHTENLAANLEDLTFLLTLPRSLRTFLTYPMVGNWYLDRMSKFNPQTKQQEEVHSGLKSLIAETRFKNHHMHAFYDNPEGYNQRWDELSAKMLATPDESLPLHQMMEWISQEFVLAYGEGSFRNREEFTTDFGHGLVDPAREYAYLTWYFGQALQKGVVGPLDLTLMVVDDQDPQRWYQRLIAVGFKHQEDQQGYFFDGETALKALRRPGTRYDVILSDIELGEGNMDGITFAERAYALKTRRREIPLISVFSYSDERLKEADSRLGWRRDRLPKVFQFVNNNNKVNFTAMRFRNEVVSALTKLNP